MDFRALRHNLAEALVLLIPLSWLLGVTVFSPLIILGLGLTFAVVTIQRNNRPTIPAIKLTEIGGLILVFTVYGLVSFAWSSPVSLSTLNARNPVLIAFACICVIVLIDFFRSNLVNDAQGRRLCLCVALMGPVLLTLVVIDTPFMGGPLLQPESYRLQNARLNFSLAVNQNPNTASYFFGTGILATMRALHLHGIGFAIRVLCMIGIASYAILFAFCGSFSSGVGLFVAVAAMTLLYRDRRAFVSALVVFLCFAGGLFIIQLLCECAMAEQAREKSAAVRLEVWRGMIALWAEKQWLGHGFFTPLEVQVAETQKYYTAHSLLLQQLASGGIVGFVLIMAIMVCALNTAIICWKRGEALPVSYLIFAAPIILTHKHMVFLPEPYLWQIVWGPLILPGILLRHSLTPPPETGQSACVAGR